MQEGVLLETDVHECGFKAIFEIAHFAFEDAADQAFVVGPLDGEFLQPAFLGDGHAGFERLRVDDDLLVDFFDWLDQALDSLDQRGGRAPDGLDEAFWAFLKGDGRKGFFFLHLGGGGQVGLAEAAFVRQRRFWGFLGRALRGQAGGDVFGALNFVSMAVVVHLILHGGAADGLGAGLRGVAVRALLAVTQPAGRAKTHAAAPPSGKISVSHT